MIWFITSHCLITRIDPVTYLPGICLTLESLLGTRKMVIIFSIGLLPFSCLKIYAKLTHTRATGYNIQKEKNLWHLKHQYKRYPLMCYKTHDQYLSILCCSWDLYCSRKFLNSRNFYVICRKVSWLKNSIYFIISIFFEQIFKVWC